MFKLAQQAFLLGFIDSLEKLAAPKIPSGVLLPQKGRFKSLLDRLRGHKPAPLVGGKGSQINLKRSVDEVLPGLEYMSKHTKTTSGGLANKMDKNPSQIVGDRRDLPSAHKFEKSEFDDDSITREVIRKYQKSK